jgi:membrane fusion protein (multidrug efflux system)
MAATFSRTLRSLEADGPRHGTISLLILALLIMWAVWSFCGRVRVYEVTQEARLEVDSAAHPVAAPVDGRVVETRMAIGRAVREGEVLIMLDAEAQRLAIRERRARQGALAVRLDALRREIQAEREAGAAQREERAIAIAVARAQVAEAEARARLAGCQLERLAALRARQAASVEEFQKARAEAEVSRATVRTLALVTDRIGQDQRVQESERKTRLAKLECEAVVLQGESAIAEAAIAALEHEAALHVIRAPVSGRVGELAAELRAGSVVRAGERIGCIIPPGEPRAVALFPVAAVGRVRPGQAARLRLDGFPWTQYGTLPATVAGVGDEARGGVIRVELTLAPDPASAIPLGHGLPGSAEVEVERISPATLILRAAGQFLMVRRPARAT